jgi:hypothetical protein
MTHTVPAIRSVPSIIHSKFPELSLAATNTRQDHIYVYVLAFVPRRHGAPSDIYFIGRIAQSPQLKFQSNKISPCNKAPFGRGVNSRGFQYCRHKPKQHLAPLCKKGILEEIVVYFPLILQGPHRKGRGAIC